MRNCIKKISKKCVQQFFLELSDKTIRPASKIECCGKKIETAVYLGVDSCHIEAQRAAGRNKVDDRVGQDFLFHAVVPLSGWQLRAVDRGGGLVSPVDQRVQLLDLLPTRRGQEPVVQDQQLDLDELIE